MVPLSAATALCRLLPPLCGNRTRREILRSAGIRIGDRTTFGGTVHFDGAGHSAMLEIGTDCWINTGVRFGLGGRVVIGDRVSIAHDVSVGVPLHQLRSSPASDGTDGTVVTIGDGCWLGARCIIRSGVTVGAGSIIAAGAVVTEEVAPDSLVAGSPARVLKVLL